jgi:hypothetical protein
MEIPWPGYYCFLFAYLACVCFLNHNHSEVLFIAVLYEQTKIKG